MKHVLHILISITFIFSDTASIDIMYNIGEVNNAAAEIGGIQFNLPEEVNIISLSGGALENYNFFQAIYQNGILAFLNPATAESIPQGSGLLTTLEVEFDNIELSDICICGLEISNGTGVFIYFPSDIFLDCTSFTLGQFESSEELGCMDSQALNYDIQANTDDGSCAYLGDSNLDGDINVADITLIIQYIIGDYVLNDIQLLAADLDDSGHVNVGDIILIIEAIFNQ